MSTSRILLILIFIGTCTGVFSQHVELFSTGNTASLRGLSAVSDKTVWVSGSKGTVGRTNDGGKTWKWLPVTGYETRDFRDIEAFDGRTAVIMAVGEPGIILRTVNGGETWKKVYENSVQGIFLDALEFWNDESGIVIGDPINGRFIVARSFDGGHTWKNIAFDKLPAADSGEACFAASGTLLRALDRDEACFVTGGKRSRMFWKGEPVLLPIQQGKESQGANSLAIWFKGYKHPHIVIVGGDFNNDSSRVKNCTVSRDGGKTWIKPSNPPYGYRSCVEFITQHKLVTCGTSGVDVSHDQGINWNAVSSKGFHVCRKAKKGNTVFLAGAHGTIGKLVW